MHGCPFFGSPNGGLPSDFIFMNMLSENSIRILMVSFLTLTAAKCWHKGHEAPVDPVAAKEVVKQLKNTKKDTATNVLGNVLRELNGSPGYELTRTLVKLVQIVWTAAERREDSAREVDMSQKIVRERDKVLVPGEDEARYTLAGGFGTLGSKSKKSGEEPEKDLWDLFEGLKKDADLLHTQQRLQRSFQAWFGCILGQIGRIEAEKRKLLYEQVGNLKEEKLRVVEEEDDEEEEEEEETKRGESERSAAKWLHLDKKTVPNLLQKTKEVEEALDNKSAVDILDALNKYIVDPRGEE